MNETKKDANIPIIQDMLRCNAACAGSFAPKEFRCEEDAIDWLYRNLPTVRYAVKQTVNHIFSNGMTTGNDEQDERLDAWLYGYNIRGVTNYSVLENAIEEAMIYGKCGLRFLSEEDGLLTVNSRYFNAITEDNEDYYGFKNTIGYLLSFGKEKIYEVDRKEINFDRAAYEKTGVIVDKEKKLMILSKETFVSVRENPTQEAADSPLSYDRQRLELIKRIYERLNYDIEYDGPGRLVLRVNDHTGDIPEGATGASEVMNQSSTAQESRSKQIRAEATGLAKQIKESTESQVITVSNIFDKDITHLPRVTKATDLMPLLDNAEEIVAQLFAINPVLLSIGKMNGNVSMEKVIDNAMLNTIIPIREKYATQLSKMLAAHLGFEKIYFNKYELKQKIDENEQRVKIAGIAKLLKDAGYDEVADGFAEQLKQEIDPEKSQPIKKKKKKTLFGRKRK